MPKLKVRNRPPQDSIENSGPSHSGSLSVITDYAALSRSGTATLSLPHSPQSSVTQVIPTSPNRIPKIAVRNRPCNGDPSSEIFAFPFPAATTAPYITDERSQDTIDAIEPVPSPRAEPSYQSHLHSAEDITSDSQAPTKHDYPPRDSTGSNGSSKPPAKKKGRVSSVFGFLSVKEPSAIALQQFTDSQRKQTEMKGGRNPATGLAGITDRKLPPTVPKVNSKWDGLPEWAREAAKEAKKNERNKSDTLLNKMANHRRPTSQHDSVSTFGSSDSNRIQSGSRPTTAKNNTSKTSQRPDLLRNTSASSSTKKLRNPSGGEGSMTRIHSSFEQNCQSRSAQKLAPTTTPASLKDLSAIAPSNPSTTPTSPGTRIFTHAHQRTMSDPRLNFGMDNVAAITAFLGDEDVSVPEILPKPNPSSPRPLVMFPASASEAPPPIPRRSSRRQVPKSHLNQITTESEADWPSSSDSVDSFATAAQAPSLSDFPSPPSFPKAETQGEEDSTNDLRATDSTTSQKTQVCAIFPPDSPTLTAAILSSQPNPLPRALPSSPSNESRRRSPLGGVSVTPEESVPQDRAQSRATSPSPTELSEQWFQTPQERLGFVAPSPSKNSAVAPWETSNEAIDIRPSPTVSNFSRPMSVGTVGGKRARWSGFGKKSLN